MLTTRTQHIKDSLFAQPRQISMERATLFMESYKATEGEPYMFRWLRHFATCSRIIRL